MFVANLRGDMVAALQQLDTALPGPGWLNITDRSTGPITLSPHEAAPEPVSLRRVKAEVGRRWARSR